MYYFFEKLSDGPAVHVQCFRIYDVPAVRVGREVPNLIRFEDLYPNFDTIVQQLTTHGGVPTIHKVKADGTGR